MIFDKSITAVRSHSIADFTPLRRVSKRQRYQYVMSQPAAKNAVDAKVKKLGSLSPLSKMAKRTSGVQK